MRDEVNERPREPAYIPPAPLVSLSRLTRSNLRWAATEANQAQEWAAHGLRIAASRDAWWHSRGIVEEAARNEAECYAHSAMYLIYALTGER